MKYLSLILLIFILIELKATEQAKEVLIVGADTTYTIFLPLEEFLSQHPYIKKRIDNSSNCMSTDCWRNYIGTWQVVNDSLFLVRLQDCCDYKTISLEKVFDCKSILNGKVFAHWYSDKLFSDFGEMQGCEEDDLKLIFEYTYNLTVENGQVSNVRKEKNKLLEKLE